MPARVFQEWLRVCRRAVVCGVIGLAGAATASAQTTITINHSKSQVVYATIRGGSFANTTLATTLETRASANAQYARRALIKFDTQNTIPQGAQVSSALLTVAVKSGSADATRDITAYQVTSSWTETQVTWKRRRVSQPWGHSGGDLGTKLAVKNVSNKPGTKVTFNITPLVQKAVSGTLGSRYTRVALVDLGASTHESWRSYYTPDTSNSSLRPTLTVTYGKVAPSSSDDGAAAPTTTSGTVTINQSKSQVVYATLRGGTYANKNLSTILETRSSTNAEYLRRALVKFDTENTINAGTSVAKALLTMTVRSGGGDATRQVAAYQVTSSWTETQVTWMLRRTGQNWTHAGGDLGARLAVQNVSNVPSAKVTFDVTALVQQAVSGKLGSRYTRIALLDLDGSTSDSWRSYYTPDAAYASQRPTLTVTLGSSSTTTTATAPPPSDPPSTTTTQTLRVLHWNTHHGGVGTDGKKDANRLINWVVKINPDIISMNEVERYTSWGNTDDAAIFASLLKQKTGRTWYYKFATATGASTGNGNLILSRFPFDATDVHLLTHSRSIVNAMININGRTINFFSTHLDDGSSSYRLSEVTDLKAWAAGMSEQRIIAGDFNASVGSNEITSMTNAYIDSWAKAQADHTAIAYYGNTAGNTRNGRIDYIFYSRGATALVLKSSQVFDTRDANGVMPSDHRPLLSVFTVK